MAFERLGSIVNRVLSRVDGTGEGAVAAAPRAGKRTRTEARAKWEVSSRESPADILPANKEHANRCMTIANPNGSPHPAVVIHLVVDNGSGGHREEGWPCVRRLRRNASEERQRELGIRLVV